MKISTATSQALGFAAAIAILSACSGGSQSALAPPSGTLLNSKHASGQGLHGVSPNAVKGTMRIGPRAGKSWSNVKPNSGTSLLYVTEDGTGDLNFYTYHNGNGLVLQGQVTGLLSFPGQPCSDKAGNVFVPDLTLGTVTEFAHGGTTPIQTLIDVGAFGCSVDKTTGNLAVANFGLGTVAVFTGATGLPTLYPWITTAFAQYVAYDNHGNLFIEGQSALGGGGVLGELTSGGSSITDLSLSGFSIGFAGNIQWGGTYLLVGDQSGSNVYQTTVSGTTVSLHNTLTFPGASDIGGYWKRGKPHYAHIVGADFGAGDVQVDTFPGMSPFNSITGLSEPQGAVVSP
jgi:hypothetical protein